MRFHKKKYQDKYLFLMFVFLVISLLFVIVIQTNKPLTSFQAKSIRPQKTIPQPKFIVGGEEVEDNKYPFYVLVVSEIENNNYFLCGGTLINKQWILTAVHCVMDHAYEKVLSNNKINIIFGVTSFDIVQKKIVAKKIVRPLSVISNDIKRISVRELKYLPSNLLINDLALIKINEEKDFKPVTLTKMNSETIYGRQATILGYGNVSRNVFTKKLANKLMQGRVELQRVDENTIFPNEFNMYKQSFYKTFYKENMSSFGLGDSGGPALINLWNTNFLVGVISQGNFGNNWNYITNIDYYYDWIIDIIKNN